MRNKKIMQRLLLVVSVLITATTALSLVAAQDSVPPDMPYLGIVLSPSDTGLVINQVMPDSPADTAGLQIGDILKAVEGQEVDAKSIGDTLSAYSVGDSVTLDIQRGDENLQLSAILSARPETPNMQFQRDRRSDRPFLGVSLEDNDGNVAISEVVAGSPAEEAGLQVGDVITKINDKDVTSASQVVAAVRALSIGDDVTLEVQRGDETQTLTATLVAAATPAPQGRVGNLGFSYNAADQTWTVDELSEDSPLYEAGLRQGDVIQQFDGEAYDPMGLIEHVLSLGNDGIMTVTVDRDGSTEDIDISVSALMEMGVSSFGFGGRNGSSFQMPFGMMPMMGGNRLGVEFVTLDEQIASEHNVTQTEGALVIQVIENSPAADAGLMVDDILTAVDGDAIDAEHTLRDRLVAYEPGDTITLDVLRGDETIQLDVTLGQVEMSDFIPFGMGGRNGNDFFFGRPFQFPQPQSETPQPQANL